MPDSLTKDPRSVEVTVKVRLTPEQLGAMFAEMNDDEQARVFVAAAAAAQLWELDKYSIGIDGQWQAIGCHLKSCKCSTEEARDMVRNIAYGLEHPKHV